MFCPCDCKPCVCNALGPEGALDAPWKWHYKKSPCEYRESNLGSSRRLASALNHQTSSSVPFLVTFIISFKTFLKSFCFATISDLQKTVKISVFLLDPSSQFPLSKLQCSITVNYTRYQDFTSFLLPSYFMTLHSLTN